MGLFIKIILLLLVIALATPFVLEGPDGEPLMTLDEIQKPDGVRHFVESFSQNGHPIKDDKKGRKQYKPQQNPPEIRIDICLGGAVKYTLF